MFNKKYTVICAFLVPSVLFTLTIDVFAHAGGVTTHIYAQSPQGAEGVLIKLEDGIDLSSRDLPYIRISREDLNGASSHGTLKNINFSNSYLCWSDLSHTNFVNCSFREANLAQVTAVESSFENCDFTNAEIAPSNVSLSKEQLITTKSFRYKDLKGCTFEADFSGVDFSGFDLSGASLSQATFKDCNFSDAKISATAQYHSIPPKTLVFNRLTREQLLSTKCFRQKCVINVNLSGFDFSDMDLSKMNFTGCVFLSANFRNADLTDTVISDCDFVGLATNYLTLDQIKSTWNYKVGRLEGIVLPEKLQEKFDAERQAKEGSR